MNAKITKTLLSSIKEVSSYMRESEFRHWVETDFHPNHIMRSVLNIEMWMMKISCKPYAEVRLAGKKYLIGVVALASYDEEMQTSEIQLWCKEAGLVLENIKDRNGKTIAEVEFYD